MTSYGVFGKDEISKQDLIDVVQHIIEALIDTQTGTYFDAENNQWKAIE